MLVYFKIIPKRRDETLLQMAFIRFIESILSQRRSTLTHKHTQWKRLLWFVMWFHRGCFFVCSLLCVHFWDRRVEEEKRKVKRKWNEFYLKKSRCQLKFIYLLVANSWFSVTWAIFIALSVFLHISSFLFHQLQANGFSFRKHSLSRSFVRFVYFFLSCFFFLHGNLATHFRMVTISNEISSLNVYI